VVAGVTAGSAERCRSHAAAAVAASAAARCLLLAWRRRSWRDGRDVIALDHEHERLG
jgi:hypothetical protein